MDLRALGAPFGQLTPLADVTVGTPQQRKFGGEQREFDNERKIRNLIIPPPFFPSQEEVIRAVLTAGLGGGLAAAPGLMLSPMAQGLLGANFGLGAAARRPYYHGTKGRWDAKRIMDKGFTKGQSAELKVKGTSVTQDPTVALRDEFSNGDPKSVLEVRGIDPAAHRNLRPSEYLSGVVPDAPSYGKPNFFFDENETFLRRKDGSAIPMSKKMQATLRKKLFRTEQKLEEVEGVMNAELRRINELGANKGKDAYRTYGQLEDARNKLLMRRENLKPYVRTWDNPNPDPLTTRAVPPKVSPRDYTVMDYKKLEHDARLALAGGHQAEINASNIRDASTLRAVSAGLREVAGHRGLRRKTIDNLYMWGPQEHVLGEGMTEGIPQGITPRAWAELKSAKERLRRLERNIHDQAKNFDALPKQDQANKDLLDNLVRQFNRQTNEFEALIHKTASMPWYGRR